MLVFANMKVDTIIVGAGLTGAVIAEREAALNPDKQVLVIEQDPVIGGLCRDEYNSDGILIHRYGPHVFHTNDDVIFQYLNSFDDMVPYEFHVKASVHGNEYSLPFSLETIRQFYPPQLANKCINSLIKRHGVDAVITLNDLKDAIFKFELVALGGDFHRNFVAPYNRKQWKEYSLEYGEETAKRIPFRINYDTRYFADKYCAIPKIGYTNIIENMLRRKNIHLMLNTDARSILGGDTRRLVVFGELFTGNVYFTGSIDQLLPDRPALPFISTIHKFKTVYTETFQSTSQINYPSHFEFTRIIEHKQLTGQQHRHSTISMEYPQLVTTSFNNNPRFMYPIRTEKHIKQYNSYIKELSKLKIFKQFKMCGRAGLYEYVNMDQAVRKAIDLVKQVNQL